MLFSRETDICSKKASNITSKLSRKWTKFGISVIKYLLKKDFALKDTVIVVILEHDASALSTVQNSGDEFKEGRKSFEDDPRTGRPATVTTKENIDPAHHMVVENR